MKKFRFRFYLDFIPLIILTVSATILLWNRLVNNYLFQWPNIAGLLLLPVVYFLFWKNHRLGVLGTGAIILFGLAGALSYSAVIVSSELYWTPFGLKIPLFYGQPVFLLWLIVHFAISFRYYIGIGTRKYWAEFRKELKPH